MPQPPDVPNTPPSLPLRKTYLDLVRENEDLKQYNAALAERYKRLRVKARELLAYAEPPYFPAMFLMKSFSDDPRKKLIAEMRENDQEGPPCEKCWLLLPEGKEVLGTAPVDLLSRLERGMLVLVTQGYAVASIIPREDFPAIVTVMETTIMERFGDLILVAKESNGSHEARVVLKELAEGLKARPLAVGDRVLVFGSYIVEVLEQKKMPSRKDRIKKRSFKEIGGLDKVRDDILDLLGMVQGKNGYDIDAESFAKMGLQFPRGITLYGPPGCGKDTLVAGLTSELGWPLHVINGPEIQIKWVGDTEAIMREIFKQAIKDAPSILFVNEAESLFPVRGASINQGYKVDTVTQFNVLMDSIEETRGVFVILATNRVDLIDPAVIRPGRNDKRIFVPRPNERSSRDIFDIYFAKHPVAEKNAEEFRRACVDALIGELFAKSEDTYLFKAFTSGGDTEKFYLSRFISGALIENIVEDIARRALKRCRLASIAPTDHRFGIIAADTEGIIREVMKTTIPSDEEALREWLRVNGYGNIESCRGGVLDVIRQDAEREQSSD